MTGPAFHPEARAELLEAVAYYDAQADGLGAQLVDEVERAVRLLAQRPEMGTPVSPGPLRGWPLRRFPFVLIYRPDSASLIILAVAHQRRRPGFRRMRSWVVPGSADSALSSGAIPARSQRPHLTPLFR